jgi:Zn-dependent protease
MYGRNIDWSKILVIGMFVWLLSSFLGSFDWEKTLLTLPGLVLALTIHEASHARMADRLGDPTPEREGRVTWNPLAHMDPVGTICLLFAGFGWGRPVRIDSTYFRNPARDNMLVALAGPLSNIILAFVLFLVFALVYVFAPGTELIELLLKMLMLGAYISLSLAVFNLLPFPPLDGSKILGYFLKGNAKKFLYTLEQYSSIILMILFDIDTNH